MLNVRVVSYSCAVRAILFGIVISGVFFGNFNSICLNAANATELAKINGTVITLEDFNRKYKDNLKFFRYKAPTKKNVLDDMIKRELGVAEAKKLGLDKESDVKERIDTVLYHSLLDKKLATKFDAIQISDKELEEYYSKNPEIRTSHIFVQLRMDANKAQEKVAKEKILSAESALKKGDKNFSEVARNMSEGVAASSGGDIDFQTKDKLDPVYYETAVSLKKPGTVSSIVRTQFGYHIIKLTALKDFKEIDKGYYKRMMFDEKRSEIFEQYMVELKSRSNVTINESLLKDE